MRDDYFVRNAPWFPAAVLSQQPELRNVLLFSSFFLSSLLLMEYVSGGVNYVFNDSKSRKVDLFFSFFLLLFLSSMERGMESYFVKWFMHLTSKDFFLALLFFFSFHVFFWWNFITRRELFFRIVSCLLRWYLRVSGKFMIVECVCCNFVRFGNWIRLFGKVKIK